MARPSTSSDGLPSLKQMEEECDEIKEHLKTYENAVITVPRLFGKHRVVLHAFSGRRRRGDLQFYMGMLAAEQNQHILHVISLEVVVNKDWGDAKRCSPQSDGDM